MNDASSPEQLILLLSPAGLMCSSLLAYLRALPRGWRTLQESSPETVQKSLRDRLPDILILDDELCSPEFIQQIHTEFPSLNCIYLTGTSAQQQQAIASGAHYVFLKGLLDERLRNAILTPAAFSSAQPE